MEMSHTLQTTLALACKSLLEIIHSGMCGLRILTVATIRGRCLFRSELSIVRRLFEGGVYLTVPYTNQCTYLEVIFRIHYLVHILYVSWNYLEN